MSFRGALNEWLSIIIKVGIIAAIVCGGLWVGVSIYGNVVEGKTTEVRMPEIDKAQYVVTLKATGEKFLTDDWDSSIQGQYIMHGYYELEDNKWRWHEANLLLDEFYFGDIIISRR